MLADRHSDVGGDALLGRLFYPGGCVAWVFVVVLCMRNGGGGAGSMSSGAFSTLTSWRFFLRTSPPSVSCTLLPMLLSLHIL